MFSICMPAQKNPDGADADDEDGSDVDNGEESKESPGPSTKAVNRKTNRGRTLPKAGESATVSISIAK